MNAIILKSLGGIVAGLILLSASLVAYINVLPSISVGSISSGEEYISTTTSAGLLGVANFTLLKSRSGALGSVTITGADTGVIYLYDATTTDITLRASSMSSSTIVLAEIPASLVAGTYVFDALFNHGLLYHLYNGTAPTSTITWRSLTANRI